MSEKHAGFIINENNATAEDVIKLIKDVKQKVYDKFTRKTNEAFEEDGPVVA